MATRGKKIFISYRRSDAAAMSGRIYSAMAARFGRRRVFRDTEDIPVGVRFPEFLKKTLLQCPVAFVLIGPTWLSVSNPDGTRRLDNPADFVRIEVETALSHGLLVCPLLLDGARMPAAEELPPSIREVHWHNALPIRSTVAEFAEDMKRLSSDIKKAVEGKGGDLVDRFSIMGRTTAIPLAAGVVVGASAAKGSAGGNFLAQGCASVAKVGAAIAGLAVVATVGVAVLHPSPPFPPSRPPTATATDTPVQPFTNASSEYVLDTSQRLWVEDPPFGAASRPRTEVDGDVLAFQALSDTSAYVLGTDGKLWLEQGPWGTVPPQRVEVDGNVAAFQAVDTNEVYVLGTDRRLWDEHHPWGSVPPQRLLVDSNVMRFQVIGSGIQVYVLRSGGTLVADIPEGGGSLFKDWTFVKTQPVYTGVTDFQGVSTTDAYVLDSVRTLWLIHVPSASGVEVETNVLSFQVTDSPPGPTKLFVLDTSHALWLEASPLGGTPTAGNPPRTQIASNATQFKALDQQTVYVLGPNGNLSVIHGPQLSMSSPIDGNVSAFQAVADQAPSPQ